MKKQSLWGKWMKKLENDPEVKEAENLGKSQIKVEEPKTFSEALAANGNIMAFAEIASIFGVIKLGQSLSK